MNEPVKIIFKFKNNNRRTQHHVYIFIGNVPKDIMSVLNYIKELPLIDVLLDLDIKDYKKLERYYGDEWYMYFFNTYHIAYSISKINENKTNTQQLKDKFGSEWYEKHMNRNVILRNMHRYSYEDKILSEKLRKEQNRKEYQISRDELKLNFSTVLNDRISSLFTNTNVQAEKRERKFAIEDYEVVTPLSTEEKNELLEFKKKKSNTNESNDQEGGVLKDHICACQLCFEEYMYEASSFLTKKKPELKGGNNYEDLETDKTNSIPYNETFETEEDLVKIMKDVESNNFMSGGKNSNAWNNCLKHMCGCSSTPVITPEVVPQALYGGVGIGNEEEEEASVDDIPEMDEEYDPLEDVGTNEYNMEELENIFESTDVEQDDNILKTSALIKNALKEDNSYKSDKYDSLSFDVSKDNINYDENLKNLFDKKYVTSQYIFIDDTIKTIKNKICCGLLNNPKFNKNAHILPSRQYLFSEYYHNEEIKKIMIGQKWIRRSELLQIDIEPNNNIRHYEELRGSLKYLRDNIKRYGSKIKWDDDDNVLLEDYKYFYTNNEIYLMDIYNELGLGYNPGADELKNIIEVYVKVYFQRVKQEDIKNIISYLNNDKMLEQNKIDSMFGAINNDMIIENEVMETIENVKKHDNYKIYFDSPNIIQSVIHINLTLEKGNKMDLFKVFDSFIPNTKYPFIQYKKTDGSIAFKYSDIDIIEFNKDPNNMTILNKWFENAPYGISFKIQVDSNNKNLDKYMAINLNELGKIEYKTQWKEEEKATFEDIYKTHIHIVNLLEKINSENSTMKIKIPESDEYKFAFINSLQKYKIPDDHKIKHNELSDFARYFFPYVALVVEPRKRFSHGSSDNESSKFGTYLRYKRMSRYEDQNKLEQRILYFLRNYDFSDTALANEMSVQFNITTQKAADAIESVRSKYTTIKKSRKALKKQSEIPKYKPPGISIDIQGKYVERYKIRTAGARNKVQLDRITTFVNVMLYLYIETYLLKKPNLQALKEKLASLTDIARRRNKVTEIVKTENMYSSVKKMIGMDKKRLGFKPEQGQNQWTRLCQHSGPTKRRRPVAYNSVDELLANGFKLNPKTKIYEKSIKATREGKKENIVLRALNLDNAEDENTNQMLYYSCNPKDNGEHTFIGLLLKGDNPNNKAMPCCFKRDPFLSKNSEKMIQLLQKSQKESSTTTPTKDTSQSSSWEASLGSNKVIGEQLYILQNTYKIQENRYGFLPKFLNMFMNTIINNKMKLKQHYLLHTKGYFFKYGTPQGKRALLDAVGFPFKLSSSAILKKIKDTLTNDKNNLIFNYLNNGDIRNKFLTIDKYLEYLDTNPIEFDTINDILALPKMLTSNGVNIFVFNKQINIIKKTLEKEKVREDFYILCHNPENIGYLTDPKRENVFVIKEGKYYYPIVLAIKDNISNKEIRSENMFMYKQETDNPVANALEFYNKNCSSLLFEGSKDAEINAKTIYNTLITLNNKDYLPVSQTIDTKYKSNYIITANNTIIPVRPSGSVYKLPIKNNLKKTDKMLTFEQQYKNLETLDKLTKGKLAVAPLAVYVEDKKDDNIVVHGIITQARLSVPVSPSIVKIQKLKELKLGIEKRQLFDKIDEKILSIGSTKTKNQVDERRTSINTDKYNDESYQLFRLEFSKYINNPNNEKLKNIVMTIINNTKMDIDNKKFELQNILYGILNKNLHAIFKKYIYPNNKNTPAGKKFVITIPEIPVIDNYNVQNNRRTCDTNKNKDECVNTIHCVWNEKMVDSHCFLGLTEKMLIMFINKVSIELAEYTQKSFELLNVNDYYVTDIVDKNMFTARKNQTIIKNTSSNLNKILAELFGEDKIPILNKKSNEYMPDISYQPKDLADTLTQKIIENNLTIIRAYANGYNWVKNKYYDIEFKNLGSYSKIQSDMANYFRSLISDWLLDKNNYEEIEKHLRPYLLLNASEVKEDEDKTKNKNKEKDRDRDTDNKKKLIENTISKFINNMNKDIITNTSGVVEYFVLSKIYDIPIIVVNDVNRVLYIFDNGVVYDENINSASDLDKKLAKYMDKNNLPNEISIKFTINQPYGVPQDIHVINYK